MHILICDDEQQILKEISQKVQSSVADCYCKETTDIVEFPEFLQEKPWNVVLLDIDMPQKNGLEIAKDIKRLFYKPLLVFVTSHDELVYDSFLCHPFGFVRNFAELHFFQSFSHNLFLPLKTH